MKRLSFLSTISIVFLQIEENLLKKYQCTVLKRISSILRINIEIVLRKDRRFILPWLLFCKFIFPSVLLYPVAMDGTKPSLKVLARELVHVSL